MTKRQRIKVDLGPELEEKVRRLAEQYHLSISDVIRQAVIAYEIRGDQ